MNKNAQILEKLIDYDFGLKTREGSRWGKAVEHDSLVIDKDRGIFFWNSEGIVGDPIIYLTQVRGMSFEDGREYLRQFDYEGTYVYKIGREDVVVYPKLVDVFYEDGLSHRDYFYRRGLTDDTIDRFQLGWYNGFNTVPLFEEGVLKNFQMRADQPMKRIKGYYRGVGPVMFNSDILKLVNNVYYVEGPVDAMAMVQNGLPAVSSNSGGGYLPEWYSRFVRQSMIYLVFDNDNAGVKEAKRLARFLGITRCKIYTFPETEEKGYDPVDFFNDGHSGRDLAELVKKEGKYAFEF